jgi:hypothetical protein
VTLTAEDKDLDGWWAVIVVDNRDNVSPLVLGRADDQRLRAYRQGCWDPRFQPDVEYSDPADYRDNIKAWCRTAKGEERAVVIAMPAALIAAEFALPVAKCGEYIA